MLYPKTMRYPHISSSCYMHINPYPANVDNMVSSYQCSSKWRMGFNSVFKGLIKKTVPVVMTVNTRNILSCRFSWSSLKHATPFFYLRPSSIQCCKTAVGLFLTKLKAWLSLTCSGKDHCNAWQGGSKFVQNIGTCQSKCGNRPHKTSFHFHHQENIKHLT